MAETESFHPSGGPATGVGAPEETVGSSSTVSSSDHLAVEAALKVSVPCGCGGGALAFSHPMAPEAAALSMADASASAGAYPPML